jgi:protein-S-isoprenylcysteine O-methyltransferase Ste14
MSVTAILCYLVIAGYVAILIYEVRETRQHLADVPRRAKWTVILFFLSYVVIIAGGLIEHYLAAEMNLIISAVGFALIAAKVAVKRWAMKTLGEYYNVHIVVGDSHKLITSGPYRHVRHPVYSARLMSTVGILLVLNAFHTLIIAAAIELTFVIVRIQFEEKELEAKLGQDYISYKGRTWALVPFRSLFLRKGLE